MFTPLRSVGLKNVWILPRGVLINNKTISHDTKVSLKVNKVKVGIVNKHPIHALYQPSGSVTNKAIRKSSQ